MFNMKSFVFLVSCLVISIQARQIKLPKGFIQCKQADPKFQECVTRAANAAVGPLSKGVRDFGLPTIDPFVISNLFVDQSSSKSVAIKLNFTNLHIIGLSNAKVDGVKTDVAGRKLDIDLEVTKPIILEGTYSVSGKVLVLPISGTGHCRFTLHNVKAKALAGADLVGKNRINYWNVKKLDFDFEISKLEILMENLFNGDKNLGDNMNLFLNENWKEILADLKPAFRQAFKEVFISIVQRFFIEVPIDDIFPPQ